MRSPPLIYFLLTLFIIPGFSFSQKLYKIKKEIPKCVSPQKHNLKKNTTDFPGFENKETEKTEATNTNFIQIGNASDAYNFAGKTRKILWTDENTGAVTLIHKIDSLYSGYDVSYDNGETWTTNILLGEFRYPQGGILNASNQTNIDSTYITYLGFVEDTGEFNKHLWGVHCLNQADPPLDTIIFSRGERTCAFTIAQSGAVYYVMKILDQALQYQDTLIIMKGVFHKEEQLFEYSFTYLYAPIDHQNGAELIDVKIGFGANSQTGYLAILSDNGTIPFSSGSYYPIVYKTEDGGESWTGPESIQLGGPDGLHGVKHFLSDEQLEAFFEPPVPHRDSILYTTGYDFDITVDYNGNPHLITVIGIGDGEYGIYVQPEYFCANTIYLDENDAWEAGEYATKLMTFRGEFGDIIEDNRPQIARALDGHEIYYFWIDTDPDLSEENIFPDIYVTSRSLVCYYYFPPGWTSYLTQAWALCNFAGISNYIYEIENLSIPVYYIQGQSNPLIPSEAVNFVYVSDLVFYDPYPEIPEFEADTTLIEMDGCINFTLLSGFDEFVFWYFEGGVPASFFSDEGWEPPPPIYYYNTGTFDVTVQTSGMAGGCTNVMEDYITVIDPVEIKTPYVNDKFEVLPNPANDYLIINILPENEGEIIIYNYLGRKIYNIPVNDQSTLKINVSGYSSGIYFIVYKTVTGKTYTEKVVVK